MTNKKLNAKEFNRMVSLYRYFIWADRMKVHFEKTLLKNVSNSMFENGYLTKKGFIEFLYMSYWYAALYVVIEGWKELKLEDKQINSLLQSKHVNLLKRYRNGVFHYQETWWDERFVDFIAGKQADKTALWIRNLHDAFSNFFLEWSKQVKNHKI